MVLFYWKSSPYGLLKCLEWRVLVSNYRGLSLCCCLLGRYSKYFNFCKTHSDPKDFFFFFEKNIDPKDLKSKDRYSPIYMDPRVDYGVNVTKRSHGHIGR